MKSKSPVTFSKYIVPACIPTVADVDYSGAASWSTGNPDRFRFINFKKIAYSKEQNTINWCKLGWGTTSSGGSLARVLLEVVLPVLTDAACYTKYRVPDKRTGFCAGETGANMDTCQVRSQIRNVFNFM